VRHARQGLRHGRAESRLAIRNDPDKGPLQGVLPRVPERGEVLLGGGEHATGQEHLAGEASAQDPEDGMAHSGVPAVTGQEDAAAGLGAALEPGGSCRERASSSS
jgi:hypothetical protein